MVMSDQTRARLAEQSEEFKASAEAFAGSYMRLWQAHIDEALASGVEDSVYDIFRPPAFWDCNGSCVASIRGNPRIG